LAKKETPFVLVSGRLQDEPLHEGLVDLTMRHLIYESIPELFGASSTLCLLE
jgi:hypothetical protein